MIELVRKALSQQPQNTEAQSIFIALYDILGEAELFDGIVTAMQDEGFDEWIDDLIYYIEELRHDNID